MHIAKWAVMVSCVLGLNALGALPAAAQDYSEPASYGDFTIANGQSHSIDLLAGGSIDASTLGGACVGNIANAPDVQLDVQGNMRLMLRTVADSDTTLIINNPSGQWICDDDSGGNLNALIDLANPETGIYDIWVGEYNGEYTDTTLTITQGNGGGQPVVADNTSSMPTGVDQLESGVLGGGDPTMDDGSYYDSYTVAGTAGEEIVFDMRSTDFDTFLQVIGPNGQEFVNDDYEGDTSRSLISMTVPQTGNYTVEATSFSGGATGAYTLAISRPTETAPQERIAQNGNLAAGDATRDNTGSFIDTYEFDGAPGRRVSIDLTSTAFDTYLILTAPSGAITENDDFDSLGHSRIETELSETGTYTVQVTSYAAGETGNYSLTIDRDEAISTDVQVNRDTTELALGTPVAGRLEAGDLEIDLGKFQDIYAFQGNQGQNIRVDMTSNAFDTYLIVRAPSGAEYSNDDFEASTARSIVELTLPESGRYQVIATSYGADMTGNYQLTASVMTSAPLAVLSNVVDTGQGQVYGIFAGISDYSQLRETEWGWGDLSYTADDAIIARDALIANAGMRPENAFTFTDRQATRANIEAAFRDIAGRIGPNDTFVFFYSGHGGQEERPGGFNAADADGFDETLAWSDQTVTDDEVTELFNLINAGASIIILDSCYAGGFAKDVVSAPGRMGLFSSDEDVPSLVAGKFQAGGYLSFFFKEAVENGNADENGNGEIDAMELSQYLHVRYNEEAMSKAQSRFDTPHFGYQHLVVDRGGVAHDATLFRLR